MAARRGGLYRSGGAAELSEAWGLLRAVRDGLVAHLDGVRGRHTAPALEERGLKLWPLAYAMCIASVCAPA